MPWSSVREAETLAAKRTGRKSNAGQTSISCWFHDRAPRKRSPVYHFLGMALASPSGGRRSFQLDPVAFRVFEINGWAATFCAIARNRLTAVDPICCEMPPDGRGIEGIDPQAQVVHVAARASGALGDLARFQRDDVDERCARTQLGEPNFLLPLLHRATDHLSIEGLEPRWIGGPQNDVIDRDDAEGSRHGGSTPGRRHQRRSCRELPRASNGAV